MPAAARQPTDVSISIRPGTQQQADPWSDFPDAPPVAPAAQSTPAAPGGSAGDQWDTYPDAPPKPKEPSREVGAGEAIGRGALHGLSLGLEPAMEGVNAAANPDIEAAAKKFGIDPATATALLDHLAPTLKTMYGAGRLAHDAIAPPDRKLSDLVTGDTSTPAQKAYSSKRSEEAQANEDAYDQHPILYTGGDIAGAALVPLPGAGAVRAGAGVVGRVGRGVAEGMVGGGAYGAGNAIGEGKDASEVASDAAKGVAVGGVLGGAVGGVVGRRAASGAPTVADRAAQTAEDLGAPLPRGVVSNSPAVTATTAKLKEFPFAGERIGRRVSATQDAARDAVDDMATNLVGGAPTRTTAAPSAAPAIRQAIEHNNTEIDNAYTALRNDINPDQHFPMPALRRAIQAVQQRRARAGWENPSEGLQQAINVANGTGHAGGFNGVHRLRRDIREAGNPQKANPGYDKGDFRYLKRAVDADLRAGVRHVSTNPNHSESLFNTAELEASHLIDTNEQLEGLASRHGESIVGALLNSTREKGGNIALLREVRRTMSPQAFNQLAGVLLHELGLAEGQVGEFSLSRFTTNWNKVSDQAKALMFSPAHREAIENIANLGEHLKEAGKYTNNSHTGSIIVMMDVAKDAALLLNDVVNHGSLGMGTVVGAGSTIGTYLLTKWLASPSTAASMSRWTSVYRALTLHQPTPARIAAFKVATRNLANNIDVPFDRIMQLSSDRLNNSLPAKADEPEKE